MVAVSLLNLDPSGNRTLKPADDLINWFDKTFDAKRENSELNRKLQVERREAIAGKVARAENDELRSLVGFDKSGILPPGRLVTGRVIFRSLENPYSFLTISVGSADCVKVGDAAFNGDGLVGKVKHAGKHTAEIQLLTNLTSAVSAKGENPYIRGLVAPDVGEPGHVILKFIVDQGDPPHAGQEISTSDWHSGEVSSSFPGDIPIGQISRVSLSKLDATGTVPVELHVDLLSVELVQILTDC